MPVVHFDYLGWMAKYNRQISDIEEFKTRLERFTFIHNWINEHNQLGALWTAGHNKFSDWSEAELASTLGYNGQRDKDVFTLLEETDVTSVDWRQNGAVTPVKDQGTCGASWAFATTGSIESAHFAKTGELVSLSEQQLLDCAGTMYGNQGCSGGWFTRAYKYYEMGHKAELETTYPWTGTQGTC